MGKFKQLLSGNMLIVSALIILLSLLIICPNVTFQSAKRGLLLWADNVLPGIFPAMIVTSCILSLCPMKPSAKYIYVSACGLLGGYPLGAVLCRSLCCQDNTCPANIKISNLIMAYCNISSPSFVLNYILRMSCFEEIGTAKILFCIYAPAISAITVILLANKKSIKKDNIAISHTAKDNKNSFTDVLDNSIWQAINNSLKLGGYIVLFACISGFVIDFPYFESVIKSAICGILEITNGISIIDSLDISSQSKIIAILAVNSFGGISTIMQTVGMIKDSDLSIKKYIYHKLLLSGLTVITALPVIYVL